MYIPEVDAIFLCSSHEAGAREECTVGAYSDFFFTDTAVGAGFRFFSSQIRVDLVFKVALAQGVF